mmetsp:Transcript_17951/g.29960  ORF Transcript_17951/g.29960 Transcript_17951/m.29960 type:complete len:379 (+) Transcript_17951:140-1276(+)
MASAAIAAHIMMEKRMEKDRQRREALQAQEAELEACMQARAEQICASLGPAAEGERLPQDVVLQLLQRMFPQTPAPSEEVLRQVVGYAHNAMTSGARRHLDPKSGTSPNMASMSDAKRHLGGYVPRAVLGQVAIVYESYARQAQHVDDLFRQYDSDRSGTLGFREIICMLRQLMPSIRSGDVAWLIERCDRDRDGELSREEMLPALSLLQKLIDALPPRGSTSEVQSGHLNDADAMLAEVNMLINETIIIQQPGDTTALAYPVAENEAGATLQTTVVAAVVAPESSSVRDPLEARMSQRTHQLQGCKVLKGRVKAGTGGRKTKPDSLGRIAYKQGDPYDALCADRKCLVRTLSGSEMIVDGREVRNANDVQSTCCIVM